MKTKTKKLFKCEICGVSEKYRQSHNDKRKCIHYILTPAHLDVGIEVKYSSRLDKETHGSNKKYPNYINLAHIWNQKKAQRLRSIVEDIRVIWDDWLLQRNRD